MKKKISEKKRACRRLDGLLPIFGVGSRYSRLYRDTAEHRHAGVHSRARDAANNAHDTVGLRTGASSSVRARPGHGGVSRYKFCIMIGGSDMGCDTALC